MYTAALQSSVTSSVKPTLLDMLQALNSEVWEQREMASRHLASFGEAATMGLVMALKHTQLDVRLRAARLLGEIKASAPGASNLSKAVPDLLVMLQGRDLAVATTAAMTLGQIGGEAAVTALQQKINHRSPFVREAVVRALAIQATAGVLPGLLQASQDKQPEVRAAATEGLGRLRIESARKRLEQLMQDSDLEVRWHAEQGLAALQLDRIAA